jgi:hypothetical protein
MIPPSRVTIMKPPAMGRRPIQEHPMPARQPQLRQLFLLFLRLGLTSFGGPVAHLGYFRDEFVERRR